MLKVDNFMILHNIKNIDIKLVMLNREKGMEGGYMQKYLCIAIQIEAQR